MIEEKIEQIEEKIEQLENRAEMLRKVVKNITELRELTDEAIRQDSNNSILGVPDELLYYKSNDGKSSFERIYSTVSSMFRILKGDFGIGDEYVARCKALEALAKAGDTLAIRIIEFVGEDVDKLKAVLRPNPYGSLIDDLLNRSMKKEKYDAYMSGKISIGDLNDYKHSPFYLTPLN